MSWDADLVDDRGHLEGGWNYTHNCNMMANAVVPADELRAGAIDWWTKRNRFDVVEGIVADPERSGSWWNILDGMSGPEGAAYLDRIIRGLEADPERFRAMNPPNGWGDYDSFLQVLTEMRNTVPEWPTTWRATG